MIAGLVLAVAVPLLADVVHLRQGGRHEGRVVEYPRHVELEEAGGRRLSLLRSEILRIDLTPDLIDCPEAVPFPSDFPERTEHDFFSHRRTLVALPRPPARKAAALDVLTGRRLWVLDLPNRIGDPVVAGGALWFMQREKTLDPRLKYQVGGTSYAKEIHRLTLSAVELETGRVLLARTFDNNDRKDLLWEFAPEPPQIDVVPNRVVVRAAKVGHPMDPSGAVNKGQSRAFVTFYTCDSRDPKFFESADSTDAAESKARRILLEDALVLQTGLGGGRWILSAVGLRDGRVRWKSDEMQGRLLDLVGDNAYVLGDTHLTALSIRSGKRLEKWAIEHTGGEVFAIDHAHVYYFRRQRTPHAIIGYEVRKATEAFRIDIAERDDVRPLRLVGHRLLVSDRHQAVRAFDTLTRKELWTWQASGTGAVGGVIVLGSGAAFLKDGRLHYLDLLTGRKVWELRATYTSIAPVGDAALLAHRVPVGRDLVRRRAPPPEGAVFLGPTATPLRFSTGEETWSVPARADGLLVTLSSGGTCRAFEPGTGKAAWSLSVATSDLRDPPAPVVAGGRLAVTVQGSTHVFNLADRSRLYQTPNAPPRPDRPVTIFDGGFLALAGGTLSLVDLSTGKKAWDSQARGIRDFAVVERKAYAATSTELAVVSLNSGETEERVAAPGGATAVDAAGGRIFVAAGPGVFGLAAPGREFREFLRLAAPPGLKFRGALAASAAGAIFSHAGGEVGGFDAATGKPAWTFKAPEFTSPLLVHAGRVWFSAAGRGLFGLDTKTGAVEWQAETPAAGSFTPFLLDGKPAFWSGEGWLVVPP